MYFVRFWFVEISSSTETLRVVGFVSLKVNFIELTFLKLSPKFHLDPLSIGRVTVFSLSAIYLNGKSAYFGSITITFTFLFASNIACYTYFPVGIID